ncbi:MAG: hypothetical protein K0S39_2168 [Paenibacillus sp.]|jgi:hypothetical protein|nr:hypothetical protein [Paenibacillus sp.]
MFFLGGLVVFLDSTINLKINHILTYGGFVILLLYS